MVITVFGCLVFFLNTLDDLASDELGQRVHLAKKLEARSAKHLLEEYTFWDEAYQKIAVEHDLEWVRENSGDYLMTKSDYDFSIATLEDDKEIYLIKSPDVQNISFSDLKQPLSELSQESNVQNTDTKLANGFFLLNDNLYHIIGGPFVSEVTKRQRDGTYLAIGKRIDSEYLSKLENDYQLFGLSLKPSAEGLENYMVLRSPRGEILGFVTWKPHSPSKRIIIAITLIITLFALVITAVTTYILKKEQMSREEYEKQLFIEATTDSLTKVKNRRYFMMMGDTEFNSCRLLDEKKLSVLVLDIDFFKEINDRFGHGIGDKALTHFSQLCRTGLRKTDTLARIGGEEFAVILPFTSVNKAREIADRIRILIEKTPYFSGGKLIHFTVSIGVSAFHKQESFKDLVEEADRALYEAKKHGRNQVITYSA